MNTQVGKYIILDTLYPSKSVDTGKPLVTYHAAHLLATLRNIGIGQPNRYRVKSLDYSPLLNQLGVL